MTICTRSPQRDTTGVADPGSPGGNAPVATLRKEHAMPGVTTCGELNPDREDEKCVRRSQHKGRHRSRRGTVWANGSPRPRYQRYIPPHRREEGAPEPSGSRYRRPNSNDPSPGEREDLPAIAEV